MKGDKAKGCNLGVATRGEGSSLYIGPHKLEADH